ncbi:MAG: glutamine--scyllo-inositol aminotransferase [Phycisphaerae bacterium]|nr:glutamine--scyllo-inositol aminotransferase [Phycisphaerae bacterium]|tara:strand:- start:997 stop:2103 length:1107 start_codon:yes stop_codon:yes gene_type:complete
MIRLAKPYIPDEAFEMVTTILKSGNLVQGDNVRRFEKRLEEYLDVKHAVVVSSGTAALHLALIALEVSDDHEVIVPAFTYPATANVVEVIGARTTLVDIKLGDYCIDVNKIESVITDKTKAIIPVHEFGNSADMGPILYLANKYDLNIIEDAACALGTEYNGKKAGTIGDIGCFSFHPRKAITTGEGGAIVTNNSDLAEKIKSYRNHGIASDKNKTLFKYAGLNYRITDFQAALGDAQLKDIKIILDNRLEASKLYDESLKDIKWLELPRKIKDSKSVYQTYHVLLNENLDRNKLMKILNEKGIECNIGAYAIHMIDYFKKKYSYSDNEFICAKSAYLKGLALPIGIHLEADDYSKVKDVIQISRESI